MSLLDHIEAFQQALCEWYVTAQRPLPWRTEPSLYRTVVSELMAQQTQIKTMLPFFERWMQRFPDFEALAEAPPDDVLKHWEGLGYYSRARNLHKLAQVYVSMGRKPQTAKEWQALPGIGPYTSAAISSISLDYPAAVVDGNVVRILTPPTIYLHKSYEFFCLRVKIACSDYGFHSHARISFHKFAYNAAIIHY